jgi:hypothetical protein
MDSGLHLRLLTDDRGTGNFIINEYTNGVQGDFLVNALSPGGRDTIVQQRDSGVHYLSIASECAWTIKVTG